MVILHVGTCLPSIGHGLGEGEVRIVPHCQQYHILAKEDAVVWIILSGDKHTQNTYYIVITIP
jgi:hypothetical protein